MNRRLSLAIGLGVLTTVAFTPVPAPATPARVNALDAGNFLVPDDWDVSNYYSLAPEFANHLYFYYPLTKKPYGWGDFEVKPLGTFVLWVNLPNPTAPIFNAVPGLSSLGYVNRELDDEVPGVQDWDPKDNRIATPDLKLALGWGRRFGDALSVGLCSRFATQDATDQDQTAPGLVGLLTNPAAATGGVFSATTTGVTGYTQHQRSSTFALGPSVSVKAESFSVDAYAAWIALGVDNTWDAAVNDGAGDTGNVTRTLAFDGSASLQGRLKVMVPLSEQSTFAFSTQVTSLDLSTKHTTKGTFAGSGLTSAQQGGINLVDGTETLTAAPWTGMAGVFTHYQEYLVVVGVGANGATLASKDVARTSKAGAASLNTAVDASRTDVTVTSFDLPVLMGVEYSMYSWLRLRAVAQRNLIGNTKVVTASSQDTNADGVVDSSASTTSETHGIDDWLLRLGVGLTTDRIGWDILFNLQPTPSDYANPLNTSPRKVTWRDPSITTAVVYKW